LAASWRTQRIRSAAAWEWSPNSCAVRLTQPRVPNSGDAAQCGCDHSHVGGQRLRRCQLAEQPPLLADAAFGGEG
jgi:hypothetical protein